MPSNKRGRSGGVCEPEVRTEQPPDTEQFGAGGECIDGDADQRHELRRPRDYVTQYRPAVGATVRPHAEKRGGRDRPFGRIDDDACRSEREAVRRCQAPHHMGFHIDRAGAGRFVQFSFHGRLGDRSVDAEDWSVGCAGNGRDQTARPGRVGRMRNMRIEHGRRDDPISGAKVGGEPASHAEADDAAIALADGALNDVWQIAPGVAANDQHTGAGGDLGFKAHADKRNDDAVALFESGVQAGIAVQASFGEISPGASILAGELSLADELSLTG